MKSRSIVEFGSFEVRPTYEASRHGKAPQDDGPAGPPLPLQLAADRDVPTHVRRTGA